MGRLAPDPGGIAVWSVSNFAALAAMADELASRDQPLHVESAGVYADIGDEIL
jgi:hypothetical protein